MPLTNSVLRLEYGVTQPQLLTGFGFRHLHASIFERRGERPKAPLR